MSQSTTTLAMLEADLIRENEALEQAVKRSSVARNEETTARNRVNDLQKRIDDHVSALRSKARDGTDWQSSREIRERSAHTR